MSSERWHRLDELFAAALQQSPETRAGIIAQLCDGDETLRADALSLLAAAAASGDFLNTPALGALASDFTADGWSLRPGEHVGAYRVDSLLGYGGSGEVWRAHDERLGRDVAIKMLLPHFARDVDRMRRFEQEARTAGALNHPNILAVYDVGQHRGAPFLVSECLEGESLRQRLEAGPLAVDEALVLGLQMARGLAAAHARGIIHRDLKPDNIFFRSDGGVKILDFGLAKLQLSSPEEPVTRPQTMAGVIAGTPGYMAPEQVRAGDVDGRADIFAVGAVLYEALSGFRPFTGANSVEILHAILTAEPPDLGSVRRDVPAAISHVVHRCLEKSPDARFQSAGDLADALDAPRTTGRLTPVREPTATPSLAERIAQSPLPVDQALSLAQQIAAALQAAHERRILHLNLRPSNIRLTADGAVKVVDFACDMTPGDVRAGHAVYASPEQVGDEPVDRRADIWAFGCVLFEMLTGRAAFPARRDAEPLVEIVARHVDWGALPAATPPPVRAVLHRCLQKDQSRRLRDAGDLRLQLEDTGETGVPGRGIPPGAVRLERSAMSARLPWVVTTLALLAATALAIALIQRSRGKDEAAPGMRFSAVTNFAGVEAQPSLSPDGRSVVFVSNRGGQWDLYVSLVSGGNLIQVTNDPNVEIAPHWSPDGTRLLFARLNETALTDIWVAPAFGGTARRIMLSAATPAWSRDGKSIAYRSQVDEALWMAEANGANPRRITQLEASALRHSQPAFSHDGRSLAFIRQVASQRSELAVVNLETGAIRELTRDGALALSPRWSPDGRFVYFASSRGGTLSIWKIAVASGEIEAITAGQDDNEELDLSADGKRLVFSSARTNIGLAEVSLDDRSRGRFTWLTAGSARGETAPQYSPDGRRIAYFCNRNSLEQDTLWIMDADGGNAGRILDDGRFNIHPRWAPDGQELLFVSRAPGQPARPGPNELRRISLAGGAPQRLGITPSDSTWGDIGPDGRLIYRTSALTGEIYNPRTNQRQQVQELAGSPWWSPDGRAFAFAVFPSGQPDANDGVWTVTMEGARRQVFAGWVVWFAFDRAGDILVLEGKPDLKGFLWRVEAGGRRTMVAEVPLLLRHAELTPARFHVHPDGRRIVIEARPVFESNIGVIDNVR